MKIAHICPFYDPAIGGVRQVVEELATRQLKEGNEVHVFTSDWDKEKRVKDLEEEINGIKVHRIKHIARAANFMTFWPGLLPRLISEKFDIIHSHLFAHPHFVLASIASKLKKTPHIHTTHCPWSDAPRSLIGRLGILVSYNIFSRIALSAVKKVIAITPWEIEFLKKYGAKEENIRVVPNGMGDIFFSDNSGKSFRKKYGLKGDVVLFFGRLNYTKGPVEFVKIAKKVLREKPDTTFLIRGPDEGLKREVIKEIGKEKRIILLPETRNKKEIVEMYKAADIYVMPSYREGLPLTLFEGMAAGLPIIATPVNGIPYEIKEPDNGYLVKYGDNEKFKERIIHLLKDNKLREKISNNNKERAKNYNWDIISKRTLEIYKEAMK